MTDDHITKNLFEDSEAWFILHNNKGTEYVGWLVTINERNQSINPIPVPINMWVGLGRVVGWVKVGGNMWAGLGWGPVGPGDGMGEGWRQ